MAYQHGNKWVVSVRLPEGKSEKHLFKNKEEAELFQAQFNYDKKTNPTRRTRPIASDLTFKQVAIEYLQKRGESSPGVITDMFYLNDVIIPIIGGVHVRDMNENHFWKIVSEYQKPTRKVFRKDKESGKLIDTGIFKKSSKNSSINRRMDIVVAIMKYAFKRGYVKNLIPWDKLKSDADLIMPPSLDEAKALLEHAPEHLKRAIALASYTGIRPGPIELYCLKWDQIDWNQNAIFVKSAKKGGLKVRSVPIHPRLLELLKAWKAQDGEGQFIIHFRGKPVSHVKRAWESTKRKAGITRRLRPYDLRHYFVTSALGAGGDLKSVSQMVGHSTPTLTLNTYQHVIDKNKVAAIAGLPDLG
ncbi:tyrosine-type recombinase/integrase [Fundidesulfovibrio putealis]|uniref:tyrosine-type recombinase/integrase n=1 Tax=Fundidesulfovibrio putealis TaxID=270496 RepID=UPI000489A77D|nr:site-specific integrase [Fundidesulfovibrio putealis]